MSLKWRQEWFDTMLSVPVDEQTRSNLLFATYLFGSIVHDATLYGHRIQEELMIESKGYQLLVRKATVDNIMALLEDRFPGEAVSVVKPALLNIDDLQKLQQLHVAAPKVSSLEAFAQMIHEIAA